MVVCAIASRGSCPCSDAAKLSSQPPPSQPRPARRRACGRSARSCPSRRAVAWTPLRAPLRPLSRLCSASRSSSRTSAAPLRASAPAQPSARLPMARPSSSPTTRSSRSRRCRRLARRHCFLASRPSCSAPRRRRCWSPIRVPDCPTRPPMRRGCAAGGRPPSACRASTRPSISRASFWPTRLAGGPSTSPIAAAVR